MAIRRVHLLLPATALLAACGSSPGPDPARVEARGAWARATAPGQDSGGVFVELRNRGGEADRLVGGSTPAAGAVEIHAMIMDGPVTRMRRQDGVDIPAGGSVGLAPGGTHLMLVGLEAPLEVGSSLPLSLEFEKAGPTQLVVQVRPIGASGPRDQGDE
jgi:copper(I)-binding protein